MPIAEYPLKARVSTGIRYASAFELWEAAVTAGLDLEKLHQGEYKPEFLAYVVAWWRGHMLVSAHSQDAASPRPKGKR